MEPQPARARIRGNATCCGDAVPIAHWGSMAAHAPEQRFTVGPVGRRSAAPCHGSPSWRSACAGVTARPRCRSGPNAALSGVPAHAATRWQFGQGSQGEPPAYRFRKATGMPPRKRRACPRASGGGGPAARPNAVNHGSKQMFCPPFNAYAGPQPRASVPPPSACRQDGDSQQPGAVTASWYDGLMGFLPGRRRSMAPRRPVGAWHQQRALAHRREE